MQANYTINTTCLRYIVPFKYNGPFDNAIKNVDGCNQLWKRVISSDKDIHSELYSYVRNEFRFDNETEISDKKMGFEWEVSNRFKDKELMYYPEGFEKTEHAISFQISDMGMLLCRNRLGLFWYEVSIPEDLMDSDALLKFQCVVRELNPYRVTKVWEIVEKESKHSLSISNVLSVRPFSFGNWIQSIIGFLNVTYFSERVNNYESMLEMTFSSINERYIKENAHSEKLPNKAILFTYASLGEKEITSEEEKKTYIYHLTNGYSDSHRFSQDISREMKCPFDNAYWYATQEGAAYLAWPDKGNEKFFNESFPFDRVRSDYFTLYLKVLYQSFSILLYAERIQKEVSATNNMYLNEAEDKSITALCAEINLFLAKSMATSVSHIHHQSEFYVYLKKQLRIHDDVKSVTSGLNALDVLHREQDKIESEKELREREKRDKESDENLQHTMEFLSVLSVFSALIDCFDIVKNVLNTEGELWTLPSITIVIEIILLGGIVVVGGHTYLEIRKARKKQKENEKYQ